MVFSEAYAAKTRVGLLRHFRSNDPIPVRRAPVNGLGFHELAFQIIGPSYGSCDFRRIGSGEESSYVLCKLSQGAPTAAIQSGVNQPK